MPAIDRPPRGLQTSSRAEPSLHALLLDVDAESAELDDVRAEFSSIPLARRAARSGAPAIAADEWLASSGTDRRRFDEAAERAALCGVLALTGSDAARVGRAAWEVLTAYQRHLGRRNRWSRCATFDAVLDAHAELHASDKPLVVADHRHALDTWQWLLRLAPDAPLALQVAALFHDVERLASEADRRVEHLAADYDAFKDAHAREGAAIARLVLTPLGVPERAIARVVDLLVRHERGGAGDPELATLVDADALSFFSLNSPGYVDYFGLEQARRKVAWTIARLSPPRRPLLRRVRLRGDVRALVDAVGGAAAAAPPALTSPVIEGGA